MSQTKQSAGTKSSSTPNRLQEITGDERDHATVESGGDRMTPIGRGENALYVGIDLGTSRTSASASNGARHTALSWLGYCKDVIGQKRLGKSVLIGKEALENRLALDMVQPLKNGVIDASHPRAREAVRELLGHVITLCEPKPDQPIYAVVGAPARASVESQKLLLEALDPLVTSAMIVSEPFAVAYGMDVLSEALVIDIGAGTTDLCRMHGTLPSEEDQTTLLAGGDAVDERLEQEILKRYPKVQLTRNMVRQMKEKYGFVADPHQKCEVTLTEEGRPKKFDITDALRAACQSIVPEIIDAIYHLIGSFDPEFQAKLRGNVILAGGGSRLSGLPLLLENALTGLGGGTVAAVEEPMYAGSNGGLKMALEMPAKYWKALAPA